MKIADVAEQLGMPASTIRYYEKAGLIEQQRRVSGRRQFDQRALMTLRFAQLAQGAGFTLAEIRSLLDGYAKDPNPPAMWKPFAQSKQMAVRQQIADLQRMDRILRELIECRCASLSECVQSAYTELRDD